MGIYTKNKCLENKCLELYHLAKEINLNRPTSKKTSCFNDQITWTEGLNLPKKMKNDKSSCADVSNSNFIFLGGTEYVKFVSRSIIDFYNKEECFK